MKCFLKLFVGVLTILISVETVFAQTERGDKELSITASFIAKKSEHADEFWTAFNIPIRLGFLVTKNIEIEPEILFSKYKEEDAGFILSGNLAYNFNLTSQEGKVVPFVFGGLGFSNTKIFIPNIASFGREDENWTVLNLGGGSRYLCQSPLLSAWNIGFKIFLVIEILLIIISSSVFLYFFNNQYIWIQLENDLTETEEYYKG